MPKDFVVATFTDADSLMRAANAVCEENFRIYDVYAPYPVHGLDQAMRIRRTRLPWVTLLAGLTGLAAAVGLQFYTAVLDWPMSVGGKPDNSSLAFVPISFELTVLFGGLATVAALFLRGRLFPGKRAELIVDGVTNNVFALALRKRGDSFDAERAREILLENGASNVEDKAASL
jgi:hypothetical protein